MACCKLTILHLLVGVLLSTSTTEGGYTSSSTSHHLLHPFYTTRPHYSFDYGVNDVSSYDGPTFGASESRIDDFTSGSYFVDLPDGRRQKVSYKVTKEGGYEADVTYEEQKFLVKPERTYVAKPLVKTHHGYVVKPQRTYVAKPFVKKLVKPHNHHQHTVKPQQKKPKKHPHPHSSSSVQIIHAKPSFVQRIRTYQEVPSPSPRYVSAKDFPFTEDSGEDSSSSESSRESGEAVGVRRNAFIGSYSPDGRALGFFSLPGVYKRSVDVDPYDIEAAGYL